MLVAIDGPSGTGKSTVAKAVAERLGFVYFNTGAMYRSLAVHIRKQDVDPHDGEGVQEAINSFAFTIRDGRYFVGEEEVTESLSEPWVSEVSSIVSAYPFVRTHLLPIQRAFGEQNDAVFEGRDIGSIVFPKAEVKVFLTASAEERARRRLKELEQKFPDQEHEYETVLQEIIDRDERDKTRSIAPLIKGEDATLIDTTTLSLEEVVEAICELIPGR